MDCTHHYDSPIGGITMAGRGNALTGLWFDGQAGINNMLSANCGERFLPVFAETDRWLDLYFNGRDPGFTPLLDLRGTAFRRAVWEILSSVPYGRTVTYGQIAERIAARKGTGRMSAQAVGGAAAHNPVLLIIPCHRVIGSDGRLTGYAGGTEKKRRLLEMEQPGVLFRI